MTGAVRHLLALAGGLLITAGFMLFLLAGTTPRPTPAQEPLLGAVRITAAPQESPAAEEQPAPMDMPRLQALPAPIPLPSPPVNVARADFQPAPPAASSLPPLTVSLPSAGLPQPPLAGPAPPPDSGALTLGEVDEAPRPLFAPAPHYPQRAGLMTRPVKVLVRVTIDADGNVINAQPLETGAESGAFTEAAVAAVLRWRFVPCRKNGQAVPCMADQPFTFSRTR